MARKKLTQEEFIRRARLVHGDKYDYSKTVYENSRTKVYIICPKHGEFWQKPNNHLCGNGCPYCRADIMKTCNKVPLEEIIKDCNKVHNHKYDYSLITEYKGAHYKVPIICQEHGVFYLQLTHHKRGTGCPVCGFQKNADGLRKTTKQFVLDARKIHGNKYDYTKLEYKGGHVKVCIKCSECGREFWQTPANHLMGQGCPRCRNSKGEEKIELFLSSQNIDYIPEYKVLNEDLFCSNKKMFIDFYLPDFKVAIEYNGIQHYTAREYFGGDLQLKRQKERDIALKQYCNEHNIRLIEIAYTEYEDIESILTKELNIKNNSLKIL